MAAPKTSSRTGSASKKEQEKTDEQTAAQKQAEEKAQRDAEKQAEKERKETEKREAEEKARQAQIESGELIVTDSHEFTRGTKETKVYSQVSELIDVYKASGEPLVFAAVVDQIDAKYPEDLIPAFHALEVVGMVERFDAKSTADGAGNRRSAAYRWTGGE